MKTKKLIQLLQKLDPTGEIEVCIYNEDISDVVLNPAYWDGKLQTIEKNEEGDVVKCKYHSTGLKICLQHNGIIEEYEENHDVPIDYSDVCEHTAKRFKKEKIFNRLKRWLNQKQFLLMVENKIPNFNKAVCDFINKNEEKLTALEEDYLNDVLEEDYFKNIEIKTEPTISIDFKN